MERYKLAALITLFGLGRGIAPAQSASADVLSDRIARIENAFQPISLAAIEPPVRLNLQRLMEISNVSELSVAVIDHYQIDWAKAYGVTQTGAPVTVHTLFPACSVSKPVSSLAALRLVEEGKLSLDEDVNVKLKSWKVPDGEYTAEQKATVRRILSHTAGTTVHGFPGYPPGAPIPTLPQILNGETPANNLPVRVEYVPGTKQRYSGGGFTVLQQLMIDVAGKPYPRIMQDFVLDKLGLRDSTFVQPLPPSRASTAASGRNENGEFLPGQWTVQPEIACCGLWTTPSDLGRIGVEVALSKSGKSNRVLSASMTREMLRPQVDEKLDSDLGPNARMGLGWFLGDPSDPGRFEHSGVNTGFSIEYVMWDSGQGVVVMVNNWSFASKCLMRYLINNIAKEYGWKYRVTPYTPWPYADTVILATAKLRGGRAAIARYFELKRQWVEQKGSGAQTVVWPSDPPDYPPNEWDLYGVANVLADPNHLKDAIEILNVELREYPKFVPAYRSLAELYARAGNTELAIRHYQKLLQLQPDDHGGMAALKKLTQSRGRR